MKCHLVALFVFFAIPFATHADFVTTPTQIDSVPLTMTDWGPPPGQQPLPLPAPNNKVKPLRFTPFDTRLGTLVSVNVRLDYEFDSTIHLTFANPATLTMTVAGRMDLTGPNGETIFVPQALPTFMNVASQTGNFPEVFTTTNTFTGMVSTQLTDASSLALFSGNGKINLPISATVPVTVFQTSSGQGSGDAITLAGALVMVSYTFDNGVPVPEPTSLVLMVLTALGLFVLFRSRPRAG